MDNLLGLDRKTYSINLSNAEWGPKGEVVKPASCYFLKNGDEKSKASIDAFLDVFDNSNHLNRDVFTGSTGCKLQLTDDDTKRGVTLALTYSGQEYSAKVLLGLDIMSVRENKENLTARIKAYLNGKTDSRIRRRNKPEPRTESLIAVDLKPDHYDHLDAEFGFS